MVRSSKRPKGKQKKVSKMALATDIYNRMIKQKDVTRKDIIVKFGEEAKPDKGGSADVLPADQSQDEIADR